jgi:hypothetical protein
MQSPFEILVQRLIDLGFYDFLFPFLITSALFYALLKKSKVISDSPVVNATLALSVAFLILGFPYLAGISLATPLSSFFTHTTIWILIFCVGILIAGMFYPDLGRFLTEYFIERKSRFFYVLLVIGILTFVTSGLYTAFIGMYKAPKPGAPPVPPFDVVITAAALIIFTVVLMIATVVVRGA